MADPELGKDLTAEQEEFTAKYEFLSHRFFKFNNSNLPSSARNIHFICLLCPRKTLIACSKKNTANLRMHIERQHGMHLEEYDALMENQKNPPPPSIPTVPHVRVQVQEPAPIEIGIRGLLEESKFGDVTLHFIDGKIVLHRLVLGASSSFLRKILRETEMAEHDANLFMPDFTLADFQPVLPFLYGFANDSTLIKGQLVDCLMFGKFSDNLPKTLKKETENLMGNAKVKQEPTWAMDTSDGHVGEPLSQNVSYGYGEYGDENDENCLNCGGTGKIERDVKPKEKKAGPGRPPGKATPKVPLKKKKKGPKGKKPKGRKPKLNQDDKDDSDYEPKIKDAEFKCGACKTVQPTLEALKECIQKCYTPENSKDENVPTLICEQCPKPQVFYNSKKFESHKLRHQAVHKCEDCGEFIDDYKKYIKHLKTVHKKSNKQHSCIQCPKSFVQKENLDRHVSKRHSDNPEYACEKCFKIFKSNSALKYHLTKHENIIFKCPICPKELQSERGLAYHLNVHQGVADHLCNECGRSFVTRQKLIDHTRSRHTLERPYVCETCGAGFVRSDKLVVHKRRVHTGERPYACQHCDSRFADSSSLIHHKKKHRNANQTTTQQSVQAVTQTQLPPPQVLAAAAAGPKEIQITLQAPQTQATQVPISNVTATPIHIVQQMDGRQVIQQNEAKPMIVQQVILPDGTKQIINLNPDGGKQLIQMPDGKIIQTQP